VLRSSANCHSNLSFLLLQLEPIINVVVVVLIDDDDE